MSDFDQFVSQLQKDLESESQITNPVIANPVIANPVIANPVITAPIANQLPIPIKLNIMIVSTHLNQTTGYAKVSHGLIQELSKIPWIHVIHYAIQSMGIDVSKRVYPSNVSVIDVIKIEKDAKTKGGFGVKELPSYIQAVKPHILLIYNDLGVIHNYIEEIKRAGIPREFKIWTYLDQVYPFQLPPLIDTLNRDVDRIFCFTKEWKDVLKKQNVCRPIDVMQHAFCSDIFSPVSQAVARESAKLPLDSFIFLSMNRNQPRKRLDILIMSFVELISKYPSKPIFLMCVCDKGERGGYPLFDIFARELLRRGASLDHFGSRLMLVAKDMCYTDAEINLFYNMTDCGVSCAEGEGFGLCAFEQMGVGVPQILTDVIGHREYCFHEKNGLLVKPAIRAYLPTGYCSTGGEIELVDYKDFAKAMEAYMLDDVMRKAHGAVAREHVLTYTWTKVMHTFMRRLHTSYDELLEDLNDFND